ncbi:TolC family protein [Flavobacterium sp. F-380]|uniref:TolC family protein n=1 Tax=Flavobacterium kayseriense TaxID=2764714 RepID=A0ABR7JAN9_9FLAO|nr:TolC family protein [Flavobacterium kayseriense]MBC5842610.1 TolC family protein [Flavobacterium kayseriense]MBC5849140.1 TolC family protein [Flavobacterium kayseriense]
MKNVIIISFLFLLTFANAQQKITLSECYELANKNYPIAKQTTLLQQKLLFERDVVSKAKLPKIDLNAQATYQSAVTQLPVQLPNLTINALNKDQYRATVDVNQLIYNGGLIDSNMRLKEVEAKLQQQQVVINLYQLKSKINFFYISTLLLQERIGLLIAKQDLLLSKLKEVRSAVKNGAVLQSSEQILDAEVLKIQQQIDELRSDKIKMIGNLALITETVFDENSILVKPIFTEYKKGLRPELDFFDYQKEQLDISKEVISKSTSPKLNAFAQAGYGNPGLNMLNNSFEAFYLAGLKLNWNVFDWNKSKSEKEAIEVAKQIVGTEKESFKLTTKMQLQELEMEIRKTQGLIATDYQIIQLREKIIKSIDAQFKNGVITSAEYLIELTNLYEAKINQKVHELQLDLAQANYQVVKGL